MGLFSSKKESLSYQEAQELGINPKQVGKLSKKEVQDAKAKLGHGKPRARGDLAAGVDDFMKGRKSSKGVGPPPEPRKGRSMWS